MDNPTFSIALFLYHTFHRCPVRISFVAVVYFLDADIDEDISARCKKAVAPTLCVALFASLALTFIPSKSDLLLIYGVGGTIDYVKSDTTAQHIPEKVIKACDAYLDEITKGK